MAKLTVNTVEKALEIIAEVAEARKRWGKQASVNYTLDQLMDAIVVLADKGRFDGPSDDEITKLRRQLAACQNREKGRKNAATDVPTES